ncbi:MULTISPECIES: TetR/AcrR family transcriptional regulator [unclassified Micromonospora]|uniref:TetR/AcrR family transcriptional regulator n=1 Tax=unclassified Micromonospora TaxID=2617518 RepID=UPI000EF4674A|nr:MULTISPECIES: TetR/AcrR family transcriptional regulator [unclassified Micromonospora]RLP86562.1 TetR/AcrR family transcriptional regulator [Micromonospora sp. CV4]RLP87058.1 TetR/AcrR family transcriptional regulator [Micromonospora sp. BL4]
MTRALTRKGEATRARIVAGAAAEIRERGVDETRLEDVMARTGTSKGQLFHYFPGGKEELLLAVAQHEADQVLSDQEPMLSNLTSWPAWLAWRDRLIERYLAQGVTCPLNSLLGQASRRGPGAQAVVTGLMRRWQNAIAEGIRHMQSTGDIAPEVDADRAAAALLAGIQGGVLLLLSTGQIDHLEAALDLTIDSLRVGARTA